MLSCSLWMILTGSGKLVVPLSLPLSSPVPRCTLSTTVWALSSIDDKDLRFPNTARIKIS